MYRVNVTFRKSYKSSVATLDSAPMLILYCDSIFNYAT